MDEERNLQTVIHNLIDVVNNWSNLILVAFTVFGFVLTIKSVLSLYENITEGGFSGGGRIGGMDYGRDIIGIVVGSFLTVGSLVIMALSTTWVPN